MSSTPTSACPDLEQLAAFASGDAAALAAISGHLSTCLPCRALVMEQRSIRELARRLSTPQLTDTHRERIAAEVMAHSDFSLSQAPAPRRRIPPSVVAVAAAAAAFTVGIGIAALVSGLSDLSGPSGMSDPSADRTPDTRTPDIARTPDTRTPDNPDVARTPDNPDTRTPDNPDNPDTRTPDRPDSRTSTVARVAGQGGQLQHDGARPRDRVQLDDGPVTIDARGTRPVEIASPGTRVTIGDAKVAVVAKSGVIETVTVIAGTVEVTSHGRRQVIETGTIWERDDSVDAAFDAFREGWTALRDSKLDAAIAAFDRASDPAVEEDARYWAAVACERAGKTAEARRRFATFVAKFATSPRADAARSALQRLPRE
jgi:hypothetical protein